MAVQFAILGAARLLPYAPEAASVVAGAARQLFAPATGSVLAAAVFKTFSNQPLPASNAALDAPWVGTAQLKAVGEFGAHRQQPTAGHSFADLSGPLLDSPPPAYPTVSPAHWNLEGYRPDLSGQYATGSEGYASLNPSDLTDPRHVGTSAHDPNAAKLPPQVDTGMPGLLTDPLMMSWWDKLLGGKQGKPGKQGIPQRGGRPEIDLWGPIPKGNWAPPTMFEENRIDTFSVEGQMMIQNAQAMKPEALVRFYEDRGMIDATNVDTWISTYESGIAHTASGKPYEEAIERYNRDTEELTILRQKQADGTIDSLENIWLSRLNMEAGSEGDGLARRLERERSEIQTRQEGSKRAVEYLKQKYGR